MAVVSCSKCDGHAAEERRILAVPKTAPIAATEQPLLGGQRMPDAE